MYPHFPNLLLGYISLISLLLHLLTYPIHTWSVQPYLSHPTQMHPVVTVKSWSILMIMHSSVMSVLNGTTYLALMSVKSAILLSWRTVVSSGFVRVAGLCSIMEATASSWKPATENESIRKEYQIKLFWATTSPGSFGFQIAFITWHAWWRSQPRKDLTQPSGIHQCHKPWGISSHYTCSSQWIWNIPSCPTQKSSGHNRKYHYGRIWYFKGLNS